MRLNYTGGFVDYQLKRRLRKRRFVARSDLLFEVLFTIIRSFGLAVSEGVRLNGERSRARSN